MGLDWLTLTLLTLTFVEGYFGHLSQQTNWTPNSSRSLTHGARSSSSTSPTASDRHSKRLLHQDQDLPQPLPAPGPPPSSFPVSVSAFVLSGPSPPRPAFIDSSTGASLPYPLLLSQVRALSTALRSHAGLSLGDVAFVLSPARIDLPVLYLALLSLGAIVAPANPASTPLEINHLLSISCPSIAFATAATAAKLPADLPTVLLDSPAFQSFLSATPEGRDPEVRQTDAAAILFSSGTTGRTKGAILTHRNIIAWLAYAMATTTMTSEKAVVMVTVPLFHVYGFVFCLKPVAAGKTVVIQTERFDAKRALAAVGRFKLTNLALAPPALLAIVRLYEEEKEMGGKGSFDLSSLRVVHCGGARLALGLLKRFEAKFPQLRLVQGYGLTESTGGVFRTVTVDDCRRLGTVGRLMPSLEARIVDPVTNNALPPNLHGELWLKGLTIMKGYIGDQEATAAILDSEGWLRTGDLCYFDEDGFLYFIDRLKELIKYKGYQVPPAELETLLQTHPDIVEAAVVPYPDEEAGQIPVAFVVKRPHSNLKEVQVVKFVSSQVAPYKRIHHVFFVESLPTNAAGKIIRKDLQRLLSSRIKAKL